MIVNISISNEVLILIGLLMLIFIPYRYILVILFIYSIFEEFGKLYAKLINYNIFYN